MRYACRLQLKQCMQRKKESLKSYSLQSEQDGIPR